GPVRPATAACRRFGSPSGGGDRGDRRPWAGTGRKGSDSNNSDRLQQRRRPGARGPCRKLQPARRQRDWRERAALSTGRQAPRALARNGAECRADRCAAQPSNANLRQPGERRSGGCPLRGQRLHILRASNDGEIDAAFATAAKLRAGALLVGADPFLFTRRERLLGLASRYAIPAIYELREYAAAGGLMSYGIRLAEAYRLVGV